MDSGKGDGMSEFTPEFISETRKWMKKATMIEKKIMYKMLDEIERLQARVQELESERFNKCSDCCYVTPSLDLCKNKNEVTG